MNIYVFKTSILHEDLIRVNSILWSIVPESTWSFDLKDCDHVLRIESHDRIVERVCFYLQKNGFTCEELE